MGDKDDSESEWEYEYHESESETFYVTLDLSSYSHQPRASLKNGVKDPHANQAPASVPPSQSLHTIDTNLDPRLQPSDGDPAALLENAQSGNSNIASDAAATPAAEEIQILDFGSLKPIIRCNSRLFACEWTSTLGTDIFLSRPQPRPSDATASSAEEQHLVPYSAPLRSYPNVSVLGTSQIKLTAHPVEAHPRPRRLLPQAFTNSPSNSSEHPPLLTGEGQTNGSGAASPPPAAVDERGGIDDEDEEANQVQKLLPAAAGLRQKNQAIFLDKLMSIKRVRGETDEVTVTVSSKKDLDPEVRRRGLGAPAPAPRGTGERGTGRGRGRGRGRGGSRGRGRGRGRGRRAGGDGSRNGREGGEGDTPTYVGSQNRETIDTMSSLERDVDMNKLADGHNQGSSGRDPAGNLQRPELDYADLRMREDIEMQDARLIDR